jgi:hypothetical protein
MAGLAVSVALAILLILSKGETRHWHKQSSQFEQLYRESQAAYAGTVANYRAAAEAARAADRAASERVAAEQRAINERTAHDYETRLAAARARAIAVADELRRQDARAAANPGGRASPPVPDLSTAARGADQAAGEDRLSLPDALTATEQAIQLDELIRWVRKQSAVDSNGATGSNPQPGER